MKASQLTLCETGQLLLLINAQAKGIEVGQDKIGSLRYGQCSWISAACYHIPCTASMAESLLTAGTSAILFPRAW